jgi:hypothetical protein
MADVHVASPAHADGAGDRLPTTTVGREVDGRPRRQRRAIPGRVASRCSAARTRRSRSASRRSSAERSIAIAIDWLGMTTIVSFIPWDAGADDRPGRANLRSAKRVALPGANAEDAERLVAAVVIAEAAGAVDAAADGRAFVVSIPGADVAGRLRTALAVFRADGL